MTGNHSLSIVRRKRNWIFIGITTLLFLQSSICSLAIAEIDKPDATKPEDGVLAPMKIDDEYMRQDIPQPNGKSTLTLHGAVSEALINNKQIRTSSLEVSRFKWAYIASQANRLPDLHAFSYLAQQTISSPLIPTQADAFYFLSFLFPVTQQYRFTLESRVVKLQQQIAMESLHQRSDEVEAQVKGAYYKLALDRSQLADVESSIGYLKELKTAL